MIASILNFILLIVFFYLVFYGVYLLTINFKALVSSREFMHSIVPKNFPKEDFKNNKICVIIFANSKSKRLEPLLKILNEQTYDKENYSVHVIYAKDSNTLLYTPDCMAGAQIHCIENKEFFGKNKALNLFIEKLLLSVKFDAYVFLGSNRYVKSNYLQYVNLALNLGRTSVITGKTVVSAHFRDNGIKAKVMEAKQEFKNNTTNIARRMFDLASVIDSENCVITSDILEKTGRVCFETPEDELKYSLFLASNSIKPLYSPLIETMCEPENYNPATAGLGVRIALFKYYFKLLFNKPWYFIEFTLSLLQPNVALVLLLYFTLLYCSFNFISTIGMKYVLHLGIFYLAIWSIGLLASKLSPPKIFAFILYPIYSLWFNFVKMTQDFARKALQRTITEEKNIKSATMDACVTDGTKNVMCKMDLISEDGMRRVILRFRKKRVISDESIRMCDAVANVSKRVKTHGFTLKICQNCKYFMPLQDSTVDLLKGECRLHGQNSNEVFETLIWNNCNCYTPRETKNME